ncbi:predicted membrane protein [Zymobacter palmae]|uniref:Predicted membrane protein n=1 Tax=Zymobacter palmae TaxID=33074 RepID=A0A348HFZ4_9GAMM|nr:predicted membrane protein [Zymobacter palmae]
MAVGCWLLAVGCWLLAVGCWQVAGGRWQVAGGRWQVAGGRWQVAGGRWQVAGGRWQVAGGRWQVAGGRWQVAQNLTFIYFCKVHNAKPRLPKGKTGFITTVVPDLAAASHHYACSSLLLAFDFFTAIVRCFSAQLAFDNQQTVVFSNTVAARQRTRFDLACRSTNRQVSDEGIFSFTTAVRDNSGVACIVSHFDRFQSFGQRTDLVEFDQDGVSDAFFDTFFQDLGVGYEQVVTYQLDFVAQFFSQDFPACPVTFVQTIFDGNDRVLFSQIRQEVNEAFGIEGFVFASQDVFAVFVEFRSSAVQSQSNVCAQSVASVGNSLFDVSQRFSVGTQVRREATFVTNRSCQAFARQYFFQGMEYFSAATQGFTEVFSANRLNHEFLDVDVVISVLTTVHDVHHRNRHAEFARLTVQFCNVFVQFNAFVDSSCFSNSQRHCQNGVGAQVFFVFGAVEFEHFGIDCFLVSSVLTDQRVTDFGVDRFNGFQDTFTQVTGFVTVTQLEGFAGTSGCTRRRTSSGTCATLEDDFCIDSGVTTGVEHFQSTNIGDLCHYNASS